MFCENLPSKNASRIYKSGQKDYNYIWKAGMAMKNKVFAKLYTPAGEALDKNGTPWNIYPRPLMERDSFFCLNGEWDFSCGKETYNEKILVPFPPESLLSGIDRLIESGEALYYKRKFSLPEGFLHSGGRILLHIGAADSEAEVFLNGKRLGEHTGGYSSFSFDITENIQSENELVIKVRDTLKSRVLPYGKQCIKRGGMWYTPFSGIWQTVWIEIVPETYITDVEIKTTTKYAEISVSLSDGRKEGAVFFGDEEIPLCNGKARIDPSTPILWSPENPHLYHFKVRAGKDEISSYFALRSIETKNIDGIPRLCLNGAPYFFNGVLDQGYFSDGISTPASPECYLDDIRLMKELGFNTLRKHIKVEPEAFYYYCDREGMIVFQDMVNNGSYSFLRDTALPTIGLKRLPDKLLHRDKETRAAFERCAEETLTRLKNHPSVCYFTIFNEGWGQFESAKMYEKIKSMVPHHVIDTASGWFSGAPSDVVSPHVYFKPFKLKKSDKPIVLSEFGGYSYSPEGHVFNTGNTYGYKILSSAKELEDALTDLYEREIIPAIEKGLCGAVLTQLSDVEDETNGMITYDRRLVKVDKKSFSEIMKKCRI
ncbi:MAG: glycoside hydrolase family 2 [Ruminococcaceae bacterium]|nr:glycoside hydrolase family 2 [Oscillospiraceae bacterium]